MGKWQLLAAVCMILESGCNLIIGNDARSFEGEGGADSSMAEGPGADALGPDDSSDASLDAGEPRTEDAPANDAVADGEADGGCSASALVCDGGCFASDDLSHCGSCGNDCSALPHVMGATCSAGKCSFAPGSCMTGWADCDNDPTNGCETDVTTAAHCGSCTVACTGTLLCSASGSGRSCSANCSAATPTPCGTSCVDTTSDANNCGGCGKACTGGMTCQGSACACQSGTHLCGSTCSSNSSTSSCGATSCTACPAPSGGSATCNGTSCGQSCGSPLSVCGSGSSAVCDNLQTDPKNCGTCGHACSTGQVCQSGACGCPSGTHLCGSACASNSSTSTCGSSCSACPVPTGGSATCDGTNCGLACSTLTVQMLCGSGSSSYCADTTSDPNNCGGCGNVCPASINGVGTPVCSGSSCGISCPTDTAQCVPGGCYSEC